MDFNSYQQRFQEIITATHPEAPYNNPAYLEYTQLNWSRQQRWLKLGVLNTQLSALIKSIGNPQQWIIITEPWCGDAAHSVPFLHKLASLNPLITTDYQLRDQPPFLIEQYLTRGSKSIPKLIIREAEKDLATWGPRPQGCQLVFDQLKADNADMQQSKIAVQKWYNEDKGISLQAELLEIFSGL